MKCRLSIVGLMLILSALIFSGCAPTTTEATKSTSITSMEVTTEVPTEVPTEAPTETPEEVRNARDVALTYVSERYGEQAQTLGLTWTEERTTLEGFVGSEIYQYTAKDWVVTITYPLVAPEAVFYQVVVTNPSTGFQWEGEVNAELQVTEMLAHSAGQPVVAWLGRVVSLPADAQFDDYLALEPEGAGDIGLTGADNTVAAQIQMLRDSTTYAHFWGTLNCPVIDYGGCQLVVTRLREDRPGPAFNTDPVEGWEGSIVGYPPGSQFEHYFRLAGEFPVGYGIDSSDQLLAAQLQGLRDTGTIIRVWGEISCPTINAFGTGIAVNHIEVVGEPPAPTPTPVPTPVESTTEPVLDWVGVIVSNPPDSQYDDYFQRKIVTGDKYGIESLDPDIQAQIVALRDTGTMVYVWGTLYHNVPDFNATQIQVTRLEVPELPEPPDITEEPVKGWIGSIVKLPIFTQFDTYFERNDGERFGIEAMDVDPTIRQQIVDYRWTGAQVQVWGRLVIGVPDFEGRQIQVERIEAMSGPEQEPRNLALFATASVSSAFPSDRWGTYHAWSAIDGRLDSPWVEGVAGPGVGEWIMLMFPGAIEVWAIGLDVGYDRDDDIFYANNRIKRTTLIFSNGEQVTLDFSDTRGVQMVHVARAPGPNIETTYVQVVIEEVYPGSRYDDTCLGEVEVWGITQ